MSIKKTAFGTAPCGRQVELFTMTNSNDTTLEVMTYGIRVHKLLVKDRDGKLGDVVLGYNKLEEYFGADYQGTFVGRYANRIGKAAFTLDGKTYQLSKNDGNNTLHGGPGGYHQCVWDAEIISDGDEPAIAFTHVSPDGDENYPGTLKMKVTYSLSADDSVKFTYEAVSDKATPFNPTNHSFFNLTGDHSKNVFETVMKINASTITAVDDELIPTGEIVSVAETPLDFTTGKSLGANMFAKEHTIELNGGFDHNYCVDGKGMRLHATASDPISGRTMEVYSDLPGIQLYTFNGGKDAPGKNDVAMGAHTAFCLETQYYPDSVNHANFPFAYLQPGVPFCTETIYKFI